MELLSGSVPCQVVPRNSIRFNVPGVGIILLHSPSNIYVLCVCWLYYITWVLNGRLSIKSLRPPRQLIRFNVLGIWIIILLHSPSNIYVLCVCCLYYITWRMKKLVSTKVLRLEPEAATVPGK